MLAGLQDPATFWLTVTNLILGVTTAACFTLVLGGLGAALFGRVRARLHAATAVDLHTMHVSGLGTTMADGGEPVDPSDATETSDAHR